MEIILSYKMIIIIFLKKYSNQFIFKIKRSKFVKIFKMFSFKKKQKLKKKNIKIKYSNIKYENW
jgi:hypothetical protein